MMNANLSLRKYHLHFVCCRSVDTSGICKYDTCLKEMFYPLKNVYSAGIVNFTLQITQDATAMAMTLIFIAFGALYVSGPWRR